MCRCNLGFGKPLTMGVRSELYEIFSGCSPFDPNVNPKQPIRAMKLSKILAMTALLSSAHLNADPQSPFVPKGTETDEAEANRQAQTLFMGVHLGMDEQEIHTFAKSLTFPVDGLWHSGAPKGEKRGASAFLHEPWLCSLCNLLEAGRRRGLYSGRA